MSKLSPGQAQVRCGMLRAISKRTDPIFPAIEAHREAWKAYMKAHKRYNADADIDPFFDEGVRTWKALMKTAPTTAIGAAELARYVSRYRQFTCERNGSWEINDLLKTLRIIADCLDKTGAQIAH